MLRGDADERELQALDLAAQEAADNAREVLVHSERCPTCGRPYVEAEALLEALEALDRRRS